MKSLLLVCVLSLATPALADCRWTWDCSRGHPCRQIALCESPLDIPSPKSPGISPIPSPSIRPIPTPTIPPVGTTACEPRYLCTDGGRCQWRTVCQ
jgi:hypothetical protein